MQYPLEAHPGALLDGMEDNTNVDMFLNLHNVDDIEMSTDSAKRNRYEDGEEVSYHATTKGLFLSVINKEW